MAEQEMRVMKRNGQFEDISFDKILKRVKKLGNNMEPPLKLNYSQFVMDVIEQLYPDISTTKIDELTAEQCASMCAQSTLIMESSLVELLFQTIIKILFLPSQNQWNSFIILRTSMVNTFQ